MRESGTAPRHVERSETSYVVLAALTEKMKFLRCAHSFTLFQIKTFIIEGDFGVARRIYAVSEAKYLTCVNQLHSHSSEILSLPPSQFPNLQFFLKFRLIHSTAFFT